MQRLDVELLLALELDEAHHGPGCPYATFIIAFLRQAGLGEAELSLFWAVLGLASVVAAFLWGPVLGRLKGGWGTALTIAVVALGAAVPLVDDSAAAAFLSALLFGGAFLTVVAAGTAFARKAARPHAWTAAIGVLTVAFGLGQSIGPVLGGVLSDGPSGIRAGLWLSVAILVVASLVAAFQPEPG